MMAITQGLFLGLPKLLKETNGVGHTCGYETQIWDKVKYLVNKVLT
jgi:hypothetical protein